MSRMKRWWGELTSVAKGITALASACLVIIGLLGWITVKVTSISDNFKKAVAVVPVVEQHTRDISIIKSDYVKSDQLREHEKFMITEIDLMIDDSMSRLVNGDYLGTRYVSRLVYYRDNLSFLTSKQKSMINTIEKAYDKQEFNKNRKLTIDK